MGFYSRHKSIGTIVLKVWVGGSYDGKLKRTCNACHCVQSNITNSNFFRAAVQYPDLCVAVILLSCSPGPGKVTTVSLCSCRLSAVSVSVDEVAELWQG